MGAPVRLLIEEPLAFAKCIRMPRVQSRRWDAEILIVTASKDAATIELHALPPVTWWPRDVPYRGDWRVVDVKAEDVEPLPEKEQ